MSALLAKYLRPAYRVPALQARTLDARARDDTLRLFRAIMADGLPEPSHAEVAPGDDLPLPPLAPQYAYAEVNAHPRRRALASCCRIWLRRCWRHSAPAPTPRPPRPRCGRFPTSVTWQIGLASSPASERRSASPARSWQRPTSPTTSGASPSSTSPSAAPGWRPSRKYSAAGLAYRTAQCGCYVEQNHACAVDAALVAVSHMLRWGALDLTRGAIPLLTTLAPHARQELADAALVLEEGPGDHLTRGGHRLGAQL